MLLAKSLTGEEVARQLIVSLSTEMGIVDGQLIATMRDRAVVNGVAIRTLKVLYPSLIDIGCFSHTLDNVDDRFSIPILDQFIKVWIGMFFMSPKLSSRGQAYLYLLTLPQDGGPNGRCCDIFITVSVIFTHFYRTVTFRLKLLDHDPDKRKLCMELAVVVDAGEPIVKAIYRLEGDGPLTLTVYEEISTLRNTISIQHYYPNVDAT